MCEAIGHTRKKISLFRKNLLNMEGAAGELNISVNDFEKILSNEQLAKSF